MEFKIRLFPYRAKLYGILLMLFSCFFAYLYFIGGKPEIFNIKVFALISVYLDTRYCVIAQTNILDELAAVLLLGGIALFSFSEEKSENRIVNFQRIKALINALFLTLVLWIILFLLVYGIAIYLISSSIFLIYLLNYNLLFRYYLFQALDDINELEIQDNNQPIMQNKTINQF